MALPAIPLPGSLYAAPPIPGDFAAFPAAAVVPVPILASCYAVTTGPDRHLYWVYTGIASSATAITTPVTPHCCFETQDSMAVSQGKTRLRQRCMLCNQMVSRHMTTAQATASFMAHLATFPVTHATLNTPIPVGVFAPAGYASMNGITAPIAAPMVPPPIPAVAPVAVAMAVPAGVGPVIAAVGLNTPFTTATVDQYKLLTDMVKTNPKLMWTSESEAYQFMKGLESILQISPVLHTHWPSLIFMMIPGDFELHRTWVVNSILTPALSWNAGKTAFIGHFQRGDYLDGRRRLYSQCVQSNKETAQEYTQRFETLASQLGLADADQLSIQNYIEGLHQGIQRKLVMYKSHMRTIGAGGMIPNPSWDFMSFTATTRLAIIYDNEWMSTQQQSSLPTHLRQSSLANPVRTSSSSDTASSGTEQASQKKRKGKTSPTPIKRTKSDEKKCQYHPDSKTHTTEECKKKDGKQKSFSLSTPKATPPTPPDPSTPQQNMSKVRCYRCGKLGHYAIKCPERSPLAIAQEENKRKSGLQKVKARVLGVSWSDDEAMDRPSAKSNSSAESPSTSVLSH
jgi:hypothetical protein